MKRTGYLIDMIADPDNLRLAFWKAAKGKRQSGAVLRYQKRLEENLLLLRSQLLSGEVVVGQYKYFTIYEPKERLICAGAFAERVLHHALMNICHPFFEQVQIFHSYASRIGKGVHAAVALSRVHASKYAWYLKLDVRKFFASIHHAALKQQLKRLFKDAILLRIFNSIINSYFISPGCGLPIGNLTSQYFANHFLAELDHFIIEKIRPGAYMRYMDDMILWENDKLLLKKAAKDIDDFMVSRLQLTLKPVQLNRSDNGLPFLGYKVLPWRIMLTKGSKQRFIWKFNHIEKMYHAVFGREATCQAKVLPLLAFVQFADTVAFRKTVILKQSGQSPKRD
jgi:RNA-directed DNA polymerase